MATYKLKEKIVAKGMENMTIPYNGKVLEKTFDKGNIVSGNESNINGQNIVIVQETIATNTFDKDTKKPYTGIVYFVLDPIILEKININSETTNKNILLSGQIVNGNNLTIEDKFYEMFGIKKSSGGWGIQSRPLGRILVGVILVAGYFAYKKFKK
jgi:hypothetical protein